MKIIFTILSYLIFQCSFGQKLGDQLDSIYTEDQQYRLQLMGSQKKYGAGSDEVKALWQIIAVKDSTNLVKVKAIIDQHGWPGPDAIGKQGSKTLFLVIQHSDQATQEKYLPIMREAVRKGNASASHLALLEDRVAIGQGKKQIYGSQVGQDAVTNQYYVQPLDDPDNVDKRRAKAGLEKMAKYLKHWNLKWNVKQYKKDLPQIEAMEKRFP